MAADDSTQPALAISGLRYRYPGQREDAVRIDSFTLGAGEQALLTGRSGGGKSTLLHLIAGLIDPAAGRVGVAGQELHAMRGAKRDAFRGRHIGMVFQTFHLLHGFTALENVEAAMAFGDIPAQEHEARARDLLGRLGIESVRSTPEQLSVGQQQRVAVARALACGPELVLADEPTASLDPDNALAAVELMQEVCRERGAALLCVSHDPTLKELFPRVESLEDLAAPARV